MDCVNDSVLSIPRRYVLGDPQVGMSELSLNDRQRHAFAIHLNGVGVPELVIVRIFLHGRDSRNQTPRNPGQIKMSEKPGELQRASFGWCVGRTAGANRRGKNRSSVQHGPPPLRRRPMTGLFCL